MLQVTRVLYPVLTADVAPAALKQAVHLAAGHGATLHVVPVEGDRAAVEAAIEAEVQGRQGTIPVEIHEAIETDGEVALAEALQGVVDEVGVELVVFDAAPGRESAPPLAVDRTRCLVENLSASLFLVQKEERPAAIHRVLVPTDLSAQSTKTLRHATELASCYDASIVLLHVIDTSPYVALTPVDRLSLGQTTLSEHRARRHLRQAVKEGQLADVPIQIRVEFGNPGDQISHVAAEEEVNLLALCAHGRDLHSERPLGPVATRVLRHVSTSLLLTRPGASLLPEDAGMNVAESAGDDG